MKVNSFQSKICLKFVTLHGLCCDLNYTNPSNFQSLEVVDRDSDAQLQATENSN